MINFNDFKKLDLRVGKIMEAEPVEETDRLLKLKVDIGEEKRQLVAGIKENYSSDELIGMRVVVLTNLEPKEIMGVESQGMVLAANSDDGPILLSPERQVGPGTQVS